MIDLILSSTKAINTNKLHYLNTCVYTVAILLCMGCNKNPENSIPVNSKQREDINTSIQDLKFTFIDSTRILKTNNRPFILNRYYNNGKLITRQQFLALNLNQVLGSFNPNQKYRLLQSINPSKDFNTFLLGISDDQSFWSTYLITYNSSFNIIDYMLVSHEEKESKYSISTYLVGDKLYVENTTSGTAVEYRINVEKEFEKTNRPVTFKHYKYLNKVIWGLNDMPKRTVKARNGLLIRDSLDKPIGKLAFGETAYILSYTKDTIEIRDEGRLIKGVKVEIVIDKDVVKTGKDFYIDRSNIGYVFSGFLYGHNSIYNEDYFPYSYDYLQIGKGEGGATIDLRNILDIKKVSINKYKNKIVKKPELVAIDTILKKDRKIELQFENGKSLILKDTTYQSEYNPTRSYNVSYHPDFNDAYLVSESMFFTDDIYSVISKKTGDTIHQFTGYPYISPNRLWSVSVYTEFECMQQTFLSINYLADNKYKHYASLLAKSWSYPFKLNANDVLVDDFSFHWLSDNEFIIKAKNPEECYLGKNIETFYLKYRIK